MMAMSVCSSELTRYLHAFVYHPLAGTLVRLTIDGDPAFEAHAHAAPGRHAAGH